MGRRPVSHIDGIVCEAIPAKDEGTFFREESILKTIVALGFAVALAPAALCLGIADLRAAPTQAQQDAIRASCQSDFRTYCSGVQPGSSAALQCLQKNVASLSSACQQAVRAASGSSTSTAPAQDSAPAATTPAPSTTAPVQATAPATKETVVIVLQPKQELALMRAACGADYNAHCVGVRIVGGGALQCLVSHKSALSAACKGALGKLGQKF